MFHSLQNVHKVSSSNKFWEKFTQGDYNFLIIFFLTTTPKLLHHFLDIGIQISMKDGSSKKFWSKLTQAFLKFLHKFS